MRALCHEMCIQNDIKQLTSLSTFSFTFTIGFSLGILHEFGKIALVYLGLIVGGGQLDIDPSKIEVIVKWPETKSVTEIQSFLGAV
jgi:hypothetical protein